MLVPWLLAIMSVGPQEAPAHIGQVTMAIGSVEIHRGEQAFRAGINSAILPGDRIKTDANGTGAVFLTQGQTVYFGPDTAFGLNGGASDRIVQIDSGEVRVSADGRSLLTIMAKPGGATIEEATVRAAVTPNGLRLWSEQGTAQVSRTGSDEAPLQLEAGHEVVVPSQGGIPAASPAKDLGWTIDVEELQLASAAATSRRIIRRRVKAVNEELVADVTPSGQLRGEGGSDEGTRPGDTNQPNANEPNANDPNQPNANNPNQANPEGQGQEAYQPAVVAQPNTGVSSSAISLALGGISASSAGGVSGGLFSDAQQDSLNLNFPGNIHLLTTQASYTLSDVRLRPSDNFQAGRNYFSVGLGRSPTQQVITTFRTSSSPIPDIIRIPKFDAYLVKFPQSNYGIPDPATYNPTLNSTVGISGLVGAVPTAPQVRGATPLLDSRAQINDRATFALGEFALDSKASRTGTNPTLDIRRSDQDRQIVKSPSGNDNLDQITPNSQVRAFINVPDRKFFPELATVKVPIEQPIKNKPTYHSLDLLRRAAVTTLLADSLSGYVKRTGQTRFTVDGQVIDVTGYRKPHDALLPIVWIAQRPRTSRAGANIPRHRRP